MWESVFLYISEGTEIDNLDEYRGYIAVPRMRSRVWSSLCHEKKPTAPPVYFWLTVRLDRAEGQTGTLLLF